MDIAVYFSFIYKLIFQANIDKSNKIKIMSSFERKKRLLEESKINCFYNISIHNHFMNDFERRSFQPAQSFVQIIIISSVIYIRRYKSTVRKTELREEINIFMSIYLNSQR